MRYTEFQKCNACLRGNNFIILIQKQDDQNYYITQCPKCHSYDECKEISTREAKQWEKKEMPLLENGYQSE